MPSASKILGDLVSSAGAISVTSGVANTAITGTITTAQIADDAKDYWLGENGKNPCPVRLNCLWDAVEREEPHGIWGGLSHRERNAQIRKWKSSYNKKMT
jgi:hypothetical protein